MTTITHNPEEDDPLGAAVAEYLAARDGGRPLSPEAWLARNVTGVGPVEACQPASDPHASCPLSHVRCPMLPMLGTAEFASL